MFKIKAGHEYEGKLEAAFQVNKILWRLSLIQAVIIMVLVFGYLQLKETVSVHVELPSTIYQSKDLTIRKGLNWANKDYYDVWGKALVEEISDFTLDTAPEKFALLQKMMRPSIALKKDAEIQAFVKAIITNKISQKFTILKESIPIKLPEDITRMEFNGISKQKVGNKEIVPKECHYTIDLKIYEDGVLYVENIGTNCL